MVSKAVAPTPGSKYRIKVGQTIGGLVWSNVAYTVDGKWQIIYDDGEPDIWPIVQSASGSSRAAVLWTTGQIAKKNGWVIGGVVFGAAASQRGQSYVEAFVLDANYTPASITDYLAMGYAYASKPVEFGTFVEPGPGAQGQIKVASLGADPAANAEYSPITVPTGAVWLIRGFHGQLVQGLTQTPQPTMQYLTDGTNNSIGAVAGAVQAASTTIDYYGVVGASHSGTNETSLATTPGAEEFPLPLVYLSGLLGSLVNFVTIGLGANSNWGPGFITIEEWVMPN